MSMYENFKRENREIPSTSSTNGERPENVHDGKSGAYVDGKSDESVVPAQRTNKVSTGETAESVEERDSTKRNAEPLASSWTQSQTLDGSRKLLSVREAPAFTPDSR